MNNTVEMFSPQYFNVRSQDLEEAWHDAGQFYWGTAEAWLNKAMIFAFQSSVVELPRFLEILDMKHTRRLGSC